MPNPRNILLLIPAAALMIMAVLAVSCTSGELSEQEKTLLEAVKRYNSQMRLAYLEANQDHMKSVATQTQMARLFPTFQLLQLEGDYMRAEQENFEVEDVRIEEEGRGRVDTTERWVFWWQDHKTNEVTKPRQEVTYHMRYDLVVEDGVWKVDRLEDLDPEEDE